MPNAPRAPAGRAASGQTATADDYRRAAGFHKACEALAASNLRQADERDGSPTGRGVARKS